MAKKKKDCCAEGEAPCSFRVEAVVSVDDRGQMVLPKDLRQRVGLAPGDKLAVISFEQDGEVCCLSLVKAGAFEGMIRQLLGPMMDQLQSRA